MNLRGTGTVLRATPVEDPYGGTGAEVNWADLDSIEQWDEASLTQPRSGTEETQDRAQAIGDWQAFLYPSADVTTADRWVYRSKVYEIHAVLLWPDLRDRDHHIELDLSIVEEP